MSWSFSASGGWKSREANFLEITKAGFLAFAAPRGQKWPKVISYKKFFYKSGSFLFYVSWSFLASEGWKIEENDFDPFWEIPSQIAGKSSWRGQVIERFLRQILNGGSLLGQYSTNKPRPQKFFP